MSRKIVVALWLFGGALVLSACSDRIARDNCESPIAAVGTEQCNPYLSRAP